MDTACKDASAVPSVVPFWCTYKEDDRYSLVVTAGTIFRDVPDMKTATAPRLSRAEAAGKFHEIVVVFHPIDVLSRQFQTRMCGFDESK
jgi:hypothetical protein